MTMITPSYLGETIEYSSLHACRSTLEDPTGFELLVHDIDEWAFKEKTFDLVVTHWLIDVVPTPPTRLFALINQVLKPGGRWLNVGSVGFNKRHLALYYSPEEVLALVDKAELEVKAQQTAQVPYFQNPSSTHWRTERVLGFLAHKRADVAVAEVREPFELPEWLEDPSKPVHLPVDASQLQRSHAFCLDLLKRLEGGASVSALAEALAPAHGLTREQGEQLVGTTLMQWLDAARHNPLR